MRQRERGERREEREEREERKEEESVSLYRVYGRLYACSAVVMVGKWREGNL